MTAARPAFTDTHGRTVSYIRISVTDRCNLRCRYCMSGDVKFIHHDDILRYEEMLDLIDKATTLNITKVRLTGGEPFARKGFVRFVNEIHTRHPGLDVRVTTNATLLKGRIKELKAAGISRLNISLDTMDREKYRQLTTVDAYDKVRTAIDRCLENDIKVKVNAVALKGSNDDEIGDFITFAASRPIDMRFIEFMPVGHDAHWKKNEVWTADDIVREARKHAELIPVVNSSDYHGTAKMYEIKGGLGRLGVISPLSCHFCATCNRLRITANGNLRTCLFSDREYRLRPIIRHPKLGLDQAIKVIKLASKNKPVGYKLLEQKMGSEAVCSTRMSAIGG